MKNPKINLALIDALAKAHATQDPNTSLEALDRSLRFWFSVHYSVPFKDPVLASYGLEELLYEYRRLHYAKNDPRQEKALTDQRASDLAWAQAEIEKERARAAQAKPKEPTKEPIPEEFSDVPSLSFDPNKMPGASGG